MQPIPSAIVSVDPLFEGGAIFPLRVTISAQGTNNIAYSNEVNAQAGQEIAEGTATFRLRAGMTVIAPYFSNLLPLEVPIGDEPQHVITFESRIQREVTLDSPIGL